MRLMRCQFTAVHIPGADLKIADTLSQAPLQGVTETDQQLQKDTDAYVAQVIEGIPATPKSLQGYRRYAKLRSKTTFVNS